MPKLSSRTTSSALVLRLAPVVHLDDEQLLQLCQINSELRIERTSEGDLVIMPPTRLTAVYTSIA